MDKELKQKQILLYINGALSGKVLMDFEKEVAQDKEFAAEVALMKTLKEARKQEKEEENIKQQLQQLGRKYFLE